MATIRAKAIWELFQRTDTDATAEECKQALIDNDGDIDKAAEQLERQELENKQ